MCKTTVAATGAIPISLPYGSFRKYGRRKLVKSLSTLEGMFVEEFRAGLMASPSPPIPTTSADLSSKTTGKNLPGLTEGREDDGDGSEKYDKTKDLEVPGVVVIAAVNSLEDGMMNKENMPSSWCDGFAFLTLAA